MKDDFNEDNYIYFSISEEMVNWLAIILFLLLAIIFFIQGTDIKNDPQRELLEGSAFMFRFCLIGIIYNVFKIFKRNKKAKKTMTTDLIRIDYKYSNRL